jgi:hypothetical protein
MKLKSSWAERRRRISRIHEEKGGIAICIKNNTRNCANEIGAEAGKEKCRKI